MPAVTCSHSFSRRVIQLSIVTFIGLFVTGALFQHHTIPLNGKSLLAPFLSMLLCIFYGVLFSYYTSINVSFPIILCDHICILSKSLYNFLLHLTIGIYVYCLPTKVCVVANTFGVLPSVVYSIANTFGVLPSVVYSIADILGVPNMLPSVVYQYSTADTFGVLIFLPSMLYSMYCQHFQCSHLVAISGVQPYR